MRRPVVDVSLVAWCCAHFPNTCSAHGFADTELSAWFATWDHYRLVHL